MKVLADTSVWIDHFRSPDPQLIAGVAAGWIACHDFILAELALGSVPDRQRLLAALSALPTVQPVSTTALLAFIEQNDLPAKGIGFVDAHLLAAVSQSGSTRLWTRDKRLAQQAERLGLGANP